MVALIRLGSVITLALWGISKIRKMVNAKVVTLDALIVLDFKIRNALLVR